LEHLVTYGAGLLSDLHSWRIEPIAHASQGCSYCGGRYPRNKAESIAAQWIREPQRNS